MELQEPCRPGTTSAVFVASPAAKRDQLTFAKGFMHANPVELETARDFRLENRRCEHAGFIGPVAVVANIFRESPV
jgi:hypothetical protein